MSIKESLKETDLTLRYNTTNGAPPCEAKCVNDQNCIQTRAAYGKRSWALVSLPADALAKISPKLARETIQRSFGTKARIDSDRTAQTLFFIIRHNRQFSKQGLVLSPDFVAKQTGILTQTREGENAAHRDAFDDYHATTSDLRRAWQLAQVAAPVSPISVRAAVVDRGFISSPVGLLWDVALSQDGQLSDESKIPLHGTHCASALNASVNDETGGFGTALLGAGSNIDLLRARRIKTIAANPPDLQLSSVGTYIECSIEKGLADVVSLSLAYECATSSTRIDVVDCNETSLSPLTDALDYAKSQAVPVLFAAGNNGFDLETPESGPRFVGCEMSGALCVGALGSRGKFSDYSESRWQGVGCSNYGKATSIWVPGQDVYTNNNNDRTATEWMNGTSMATAFASGIIALAESSWGLRLDSSAMQLELNAAVKPPCIDGGSFCTSRVDPDVKPGILSAYKLVRSRVRVAPDELEPNETRSTARALPLDGEPLLLSLHTAGDIDYLSFGTTKCSHFSAQVTANYIADKDLGKFTIRLETASGQQIPPDTTEDAGSGVLGLDFNSLPKGKYFLRVGQDGVLTTGYSLRGEIICN